jgi:hypothetical protein
MDSVLLLLIVVVIQNDDIQRYRRVDHHAARVIMAPSSRTPGGSDTSCPSYNTYGGACAGSGGRCGREAKCFATIPVSAMASVRSGNARSSSALDDSMTYCKRVSL